jgi:hypothetical protein
MSMDEGYGPTWDSDDEYDNFIRKMNPPRCIHVLLCSCLSQFWEITISYCYVINSRFFILLVSFINCRIEIDNDSCNDATIVRVDSANEYGILLEVIQVLIDLNLVISKAYITSDGGWVMDGNNKAYSLLISLHLHIHFLFFIF